MALRGVCRRFWLGSSPGFTLVELMAAVVILGLLASVVVQTVPDAVARAKRSCLAANLAGLQGAVDRFYADTNVYPTYAGEQPDKQPTAEAAVQIQADAACPGDPERRFLGHYVQFMPTADAVSLGLEPTRGAQAYWGLVSSGLVFCTQVPPTDGVWQEGSTVVYTVDALNGRPLGEILAR